MGSSLGEPGLHTKGVEQRLRTLESVAPSEIVIPTGGLNNLRGPDRAD